jgi:RNA polymerase sigma-70 factor (ECF subfamily)
MPQERNKIYSKQALRAVSDQDLVESFKKTEDPVLVGELFTRYTHLIFGVCMKYLKEEEDAKDAVMEIVEDLFFDLKIHRIENFKNWLYTVAKNHCLMELRKRASHQAINEIAIDSFSSAFMESMHVLHPDSDEAEDHALEKVSLALQQLNPEQRTCIELLYLQDKSYKEVMESTGFSMKQVKSYIQNGRRNLKLLLNSLP